MGKAKSGSKKASPPAEEEVFDDVEEEEEEELDAEGYKAAANKKYAAKEYDEAITLYSKAIELDGSSAVYYGNRAATYIQMAKWQLALKDCQKAVVLDPKYLKAHFRMGQCLTALGRLMEAKRAFTSVAELNGGPQADEELRKITRLEGLVREAKRLIAEGNHKEALRYISSAETIAKTPAVRVLRAQVLIANKEYEYAANLMSQVLLSDGSNSDALAYRAEALYRMGNHAQALNHVQHAMRSDPDHKKARQLLKMVRSLERQKKAGNDAFKEGDYEQAVECFTAALECDPGNDSFNSTLFCNRAFANQKLGNYEAAAQDCTEALKRDANYFKAFVRRAECYERLGKWEEAVSDWQSAYDHESGTRDTKSRLREAKRQLKIAKRKDYYKILEIDNRQATQGQLKKAYLKVAKKFHPDKHADKTDEEIAAAEAQFKEVQEAFAILSDPNKRARYDNGEDFEDIEHGGSGFGGGGVNMADIFSMFGGGGGGFDFGDGGFGGHSHGFGSRGGSPFF